MEIKIREFEPKDVNAMCEIWNTVVDEANAFPQNNRLDPVSDYIPSFKHSRYYDPCRRRRDLHFIQ